MHKAKALLSFLLRLRGVAVIVLLRFASVGADSISARGASGTPPPTTGYVNPSKTTFSSAQMFSCESSQTMPVGRQRTLYKMPACAK